MSMKRKFLSVIHNPLVLIPPLVVTLLLGWQHYTYAGRDFSLPDATNIFPDSSLTSFSVRGIPNGWHVDQSGDLHYAVSRADGYASGQSVKLTVTGYRDGTLTISTPLISVQPHTTYLFKSYHRATAGFTLLIRHSSAENQGTLQLANTYPATGSNWTSSSAAFTTGSTETRAQFIYRLYANGELFINTPYLEPRGDVYIRPLASGTNLIPNPTLSSDTFVQPIDWSTYRLGSSNATFSYDHDEAGPFLETNVTDYKNGEAKWQYTPQPVQAHQYYQLSFAYRSTTHVPLVAEYTTSDGKRHNETIADLAPAEDWTNVLYRFETPAQATNCFIALTLHQNGTVASRNYQLVNITVPGAPTWKQPLVSITFDDGWKLAYQNALPLLQQLGYGATFYINPSSIETPGFMTAADLTELSSSGNEIAAHGYDHDDLTAINSRALDYQLQQGRDYLRRAGFHISDLATPYGRSDSQVAWYARKYFTTLRSSEPGINTRQNFDPYNLKVLYVTSSTKTKTLSDMLAAAQTNNGWLILVYHRIGDNLGPVESLPVESSIITTKQFQEQLKLIHKTNVAVMPVAAAYARLEQE
jgi:peptidoglycan/xylan/chitin deacetylase (PgdA/CDA1 family)